MAVVVAVAVVPFSGSPSRWGPFAAAAVGTSGRADLMGTEPVALEVGAGSVT